MRLLILGGTKFLGRALVEEALARGHELTLFNRGQTNPELFPEVEKLRGNRDGDLSALEGGSWDAAVDTSGYFPRVVGASAQLLADKVAHYTFISTVSVYADLSEPPTESSPLATLEDEAVEEFGPEFGNYGGLKALCERAVQEVFGERALIVRPGFIVGPHDPTDRFTYWAVRAGAERPVLSPGPPERPLQFIDVRDLVAWMLSLIEERESGTYNATNKGAPMAEVLARANVVWVSDEFLREEGVTEEDLPLWSADPAYSAIHEADVSAAVATALTFRPVADTVRDTRDWAGDRELVAGMSREREAELIAAWQR